MQYDSFYDEDGPGYFDYNPVHAIWYLLVDRCGIPESRLSSTSFLAAAITVFNEGKGISARLHDIISAKDYVIEILQHINGVLLWGSDGKLHIVLIRDDYVVEDLPVVNENVMLEEPMIERISWPETYGEISVQYNKRVYPPANLHYYHEAIEVVRKGKPYVRNYQEAVEVIRAGRAFVRLYNEAAEVLRENVYSYVDDVAICWTEGSTTTTTTVTVTGTGTTTTSPEFYPYELTLVNPGAETGDTTGWTQSIGSNFSATVTTVSPHTGSYYFCLSTNDTQSEVYQDVDISGLGINADIDSNKVKLNIDYWLNGYSPSDYDDCASGVAFLDEYDAEICRTYGPWREEDLSWVEHDDDYYLPYGTRKLRILFMGWRHQGTQLSAYFDDIVATLEENEDDRVIHVYLTNFAAENGTTGWTAETGALARTTNWPNASDDSPYYFYGGANAVSEVYQRVDLSTYNVSTTDIDAELLSARLHCMVSGYSGDADSVQLKLRYLNSGLSEISTTSGIDEDGPTNPAWELRELIDEIPANTRYIDCKVKMTRAGGTNCDGYWDRIYLDIGPTTVWTTTTTTTTTTTIPPYYESVENTYASSYSKNEIGEQPQGQLVLTMQGAGAPRYMASIGDGSGLELDPLVVIAKIESFTQETDEWCGAGFVIKDSSSNHFFVGLHSRATSTLYSYGLGKTWDYNSSTGWHSDYVDSTYDPPNAWIKAKIWSSTGNYTIYTSNDGISWTQDNTGSWATITTILGDLVDIGPALHTLNAIESEDEFGATFSNVRFSNTTTTTT